jgi:hypothetical protein
MPESPPDSDPAATPSTARVFDFDFDPAFARAGRLLGVTATSTRLTVDDGRLQARFGPWLVDTPLGNIASAVITGPYRTWRTIGPARLSVRTRSLTFATNSRRGVEIHFHEPVPGIEPTGRLRHPELTVTVADCERLLEAILPARP